ISRAIESRRTGVASQWRIRHKLMLGLALVVGVMALLLGGTLHGLWSYYNTMNNIRGTETELKSAEALKESVGKLSRLLTPEEFNADKIVDALADVQSKREAHEK